MRLHEFISEDTQVDDITNDVMDIITAYRNRKMDTIPMDGNSGIVAYLSRLGHDVDPSNIMDLVSKPPFNEIVERSTPEEIKLKSGTIDSETSEDELEKSRKKIDKTGEKLALSAIKAKGKI